MSGHAPRYTVRESDRARRVTLRVSARRGVEVVVPRGFDASAVPGIVERRADWIEAQVGRLRAQGWTGEAPARPEVLHLRSLGREVALHAAHNAAKPPCLHASGPDALLLGGNTSDETACRALVLSWLKTEARAALTPQMRALAAEHGLAFERVQVRAQASRWGSCSARGTISLNCKLAFLPPELTRHVLLHELAHTRHLNHSSKFWNLLRRLDPAADAHDRALTRGQGFVPYWLG